MTGPLQSTKRKDESENMLASADAFAEQLAMRVAALVREATAGHEALLRRQLLNESDVVTGSEQSSSVANTGAIVNGNCAASAQTATAINGRIPELRFAAAAPGQLDAAYNPRPEFLDVPRLEQVEHELESPRITPENAEPFAPEVPSSGRSGKTGGSIETLSSAPSSLNRSMTIRTSGADESASQILDREGEHMRQIVQSRFKELDRRRTGNLNAENLRSCVNSFHGEEIADLDSRIANAIQAFNEAHERLAGSNLCELTFPGFLHIMVTENFDKHLNTEDAAVLTDIRMVCVNEAALSLIATKAMVNTKDITGERQKKIYCGRWMEPLSGFVICINALCIGLQLDIAKGWGGWQVLEVPFTCFFISELILKVRYQGCVEMYFGDDLQWNIFDTVIVILAAVDMCFWLVNLFGGEQSLNLRNISIMRLARLMRITRIVRLLKLHFFKDLTIMINGVFGGLKTLFWAFVLLLVIIYIVGVMLRQVIVNADTNCKTATCGAAEAHLTRFEPELFSNVFRSMFTVFRCLIDGCSSADGTPLILYFLDAHGPLFVVAYVLVVVFILFGVFNLIMAIFVEKTLEYAKLDTAKRREARYKEEVRIAREFRNLVLKICAHQQGMGKKSCRKTPGQQNMDAFMSGFTLRSTKTPMSDGRDEFASAHTSMQLTISREHFDSIMNEEDIRAHMEDLEISVTSSAKLFDILDSNGSGAVDVVELTEGLMSLRGPADKGDIISGSLLVKSTQKMVKDMQDELTKCIQNQNRQLELLNRLNINCKPDK